MGEFLDSLLNPGIAERNIGSIPFPHLQRLRTKSALVERRPSCVSPQVWFIQDPRDTPGRIRTLLGSSVLIQQVLPKTFVAQETSKWIAICCAAVALLGARALKRRIVFPRAGYVELRAHPASRFVYLGSIAAAIALAIVAIARPGQLPALESRFIPPIFATAFAILCLAGGRQQKYRPMMWFGVYFLGLAPLLWWTPWSNYERMSMLQVGAGMPLAVVGAIRLSGFLKANPKPVERDE